MSSDKIENKFSEKPGLINCRIDLLLTVCSYTYQDYADYSLVKENSVWAGQDQENTENKLLDFQQLEREIAANQYKIYAARSPQGLGKIHDESLSSNSNSGLGYGVFIPEHSNQGAPIIIAYRGTQIRQDIIQDIKIGLTGVTSSVYQDEAYNVYLAIRKQWPHRNLVLTGHSLGGHLASYVAHRASVERDDEELIHVRTFNSAGIVSGLEEHNVSYEYTIKHPNIFHYSLWSDPLRHMTNPGQSIVCFKQSRSPIEAHKLINLRNDLPMEIKKICVGSNKVDALKETVIGLKLTYESCQVELFNTLQDPPAMCSYFWDFFNPMPLESSHPIEYLTHHLLNILNNEKIENVSKLQQSELFLGEYVKVLEQASAKFPNTSFNTLFTEVTALINRCKQYQAGITRNIDINNKEAMLGLLLQDEIKNALQMSTCLTEVNDVIEISDVFNGMQILFLNELCNIVEQTKSSSLQKPDSHSKEHYFKIANKTMICLFETTMKNEFQKKILSKINEKLQQYFTLYLNKDDKTKILASVHMEKAKIDSHLNIIKIVLSQPTIEQEKILQKISKYIPALMNHTTDDYSIMKKAAADIIYEIRISKIESLLKVALQIEGILKSIRCIHNLEDALNKSSPTGIKHELSFSTSLKNVGFFTSIPSNCNPLNQYELRTTSVVE